ncbi:hypothetical protein AAE021_07495 [Arthrobacter citreus]|uniref:Uncharacterized protein n=1 Tax=Arthrobacter citreus TaxID=1670 RepID=A0ABZ3A0E6_9MICC
MVTQQANRNSAPSIVLPLAFSLVVLILGLSVSVATGEWIGVICAAGLVVLPAGRYGARRRAKATATDG